MNIRFSGQYSMARVTAKQFNYINSHKGMQSNLLQGGSRKNLLNYLVNVSGERLTFYNQNRSSSNTLLDAINFFDEAVSADTSFNGYFYFGSDGGGQAIPQSAVPRINVNSLFALAAKGNKLCLTSSSYYSYTAIDGNAYACAFNGKTISRAFSESVLGNDRDNVSPECRGNTATTMSVISSLAKGSVGGLHMLGRETVKNVLANVGITPGKFRVSVDGQEKVYYMADDGEIYTEKRALDRIDMYNKNTWLNNQSVGDKIMVFGREYPIGEDGHIHVPTEDFWTSGRCNYGKAI